VNGAPVERWRAAQLITLETATDNAAAASRLVSPAASRTIARSRKSADRPRSTD